MCCLCVATVDAFARTCSVHRLLLWRRGIFLFSLASADTKWAVVNVWGALLITLLLR
jgi:hypothetical protein